jgi:ATP-dependent protease ClpP protease subunit
VFAENWLLALFNQVTVPICAMVDGFAASAATALTVMAPYRVATPYSLSLLHDYAGVVFGKRERVLAQVNNLERFRKLYRDLYLARTKVSESQLEALLRRDIWLEAKDCLRMGIYDRVVQPDRTSQAKAYLETRLASLPRYLPFVKRNWNQVYSVCQGPEVAMRLDELLSRQESESLPVVFITPGSISCDDPTLSLAAIARIQASPVPVFGVVDNYVDWWQILPVLFCHRRYMYENAVLRSDMVYEATMGGRVQDIVHNAEVKRGLIRRALQERATPGAKFLADMFDRTTFVTAQECLRNGIVDEIVPLKVGRPPTGRHSSSPQST